MLVVAATVLAALGVGQSAHAGTPGPLPRVTDISPSSGPATGATAVTITGTDLSGATAVDFGPGNPAPSFTVNSATSVTATSPAGSGTVNVTVTTPAGTSMVQDLDWFTYAGPMVLNPTYDVVPADGSMRGAVTVTLTTGGSPGANVAVTATESDPPSETVHSITGCTTGSDGACLVYSDPDVTAGTGTMTLSATGFGSETATVDYSAPGPTPTGLSLSVANGTGPSAALNAGDTFSDGQHYLLEESLGLPAKLRGNALRGGRERDDGQRVGCAHYRGRALRSELERPEHRIQHALLRRHRQRGRDAQHQRHLRPGCADRPKRLAELHAEQLRPRLQPALLESRQPR